ncbi:MAG: bacteriohemerythrin [Clostridiaceae bacterium]
MMKWDESLSVGVRSIDLQHKEIFNRINDFLVSMKSGLDKKEVLRTLDYLEIYVVKHFNEEEFIQRRYNYPKYNEQHRQHEEFKMQLLELRKELESMGLTTTFVILTEQKVCSWWHNHIIKEDKDLGDYLLRNSNS